MAFNFFSKLPIIEYPLDRQTNKKARDILHRLFVDQKFLDQSDYVRKYKVADGDRPETISDKLYQRPDIYSIIMMLNRFDVSMLSGLPPHSSIYEEYLQEKYSDDVYYLIPTLSRNPNLLADGVGYSGGYVFPIFGKGFRVGERIFGAGADGFQIYGIRAYVKEWDPVLCGLKLDIIEGSFIDGLTLANADGSTDFIVAHKKSGLDSIHHLEAANTTYTGDPKIKGSVLDPLSRIYLTGTTLNQNAYYIPIGIYRSDLGVTGSYGNSIIHFYHRAKGTFSIYNNYSKFIRVVTNREYEEKKQESKRDITVPARDPQLLSEVVEIFDNLIESTNTG